MIFDNLIPAWILTAIIELILALIWGLRKPRELLVIFLANTVTNPLFNLALRYWIYFHPVRRYYIYGPFWYSNGIENPYFIPILLMEAVVFLVEALIYRFTLDRLKHPFIFSLIANGISAFGGPLLLLLLRNLYFEINCLLS